MRADATCIILAGGCGRRIGGLDKASLRLGGESFIERKTRLLAPLFVELLAVGADSEVCHGLPLRLIDDRVPGQGPLMGMLSGLLESLSDINFVTTVDSPFPCPALVSFLLDEIGDADAHVPRRGLFTEPLFAVYRRSCIPYIERCLPERRIISFYPYIRVKYAEQELIRNLDPGFNSFININSTEDYKNLRSLDSG